MNRPRIETERFDPKAAAPIDAGQMVLDPDAGDVAAAVRPDQTTPHLVERGGGFGLIAHPRRVAR